jgi:toxin-antitoxin system PIN domain toxin
VTFLLDVNLLIALIDPDHVAHDLAQDWFEREGAADWATCPIVENGAIRIVGAANYTDPPLGCPRVAEVVSRWTSSAGHHFWPDDISLVAARHVEASKLLSPGRITDTYLLALAVYRGGMLATFDRRLSAAAVVGGPEALRLIS